MRIFPSQSTVMKAKCWINGFVDDRQVETILLCNSRPIIDARSAEGVHAKLDLRVAHRIHVDNAVEIAYIGGQKIVFVGCGCTQSFGKMRAFNTFEVALEKIIGFRFNPRSHARICRSSMRRIVFKTSVIRRIVRRRDYDTVGKS